MGGIHDLRHLAVSGRGYVELRIDGDLKKFTKGPRPTGGLVAYPVQLPVSGAQVRLASGRVATRILLS